MLGLPGSAYLYQGEELGLHEVAEIPDDQRQDPTFFRTGGAEIGRDGCRVPLPWAPGGTSFGFGPGAAHLPQPAWFTDHAVALEDRDPDSTLSLYRRALALRHALQTDERLTWIATGRDDVLRFTRPGGWEVVANFGTRDYPLDPTARVVVSSAGFEGTVSGESTVWIAPESVVAARLG